MNFPVGRIMIVGMIVIIVGNDYIIIILYIYSMDVYKHEMSLIL